MILTGSRAAWISCVAGVLFATFCIDRKYLKYFTIIFFVTFACLRMDNFISWVYRHDIAQAAMNIFRDNFFFGAGPGMYEKLVYNYSKGYVQLHAHNTYLEILAELGIVGLTAFLAIFINFYSRVFKKISVLKGSDNKFLITGLLASNVACLIYAFFGSIITVGFHDAPLFWLMFGLSFGLWQRLNMQESYFREG
jgi:putative inorganic carbon (HCO3(-)) transporter